MLTRFRIPAHPCGSLTSGPSSIQKSRLLSISSPSTSLLIWSCSNDPPGDTAQELRRPSTPQDDTRIHWGSSDDGWIGGTPERPDDDISSAEKILSTWRTGQIDSSLMGLLVQAADSHYRYLELTPDADMEDIKSAYRRLSKTYHPDTTSLPLDIAAEKFVRLKEAYSVLSCEQERRLYDWQLAQKVVPQQGGLPSQSSAFGKRLDDNGTRLAQSLEESDVVYNQVDKLRGRNLDLSDQAQTAIVFDVFAILVAIFSIVYVGYFKRQM